MKHYKAMASIVVLFLLAVSASAKTSSAFIVYDDNKPAITWEFLEQDPNFKVTIGETTNDYTTVCMETLIKDTDIPLKIFDDTKEALDKAIPKDQTTIRQTKEEIGYKCMTIYVDGINGKIFKFGDNSTVWQYSETAANCAGIGYVGTGWTGTGCPPNDGDALAVMTNGEWNTNYCDINEGYTNYMINYSCNYTKPTSLPGVNLTQSLWKVKGSDTNITINGSCLAGDGQNVTVQWEMRQGVNNRYWCRGVSGNWIFLSQDSTQAFFEEGMFWDFNYTSGWYNFSVYDEEDNSKLVFNVTFSNTTNTTTYNNKTDFTAYYQSIPMGANELTFNNYSSSGYAARTMMTTIENVTGMQQVKAYLLKSSSASFINLIVVNSLGSAIPNALITVQKLIGSDWQTMTQKYTDTTGTAGIYLNPTTQYKITVTAGGYESTTNLITPSNPPYMFTMSTSGIGTYQTDWSWITYTIKPYRGLYANSTETINLTITDQRSDLASFGLNLTYNGSVVFTQQTTGSPGGGQIFGSVNLANASAGQTVLAKMWFQRTDYSTQTYTKTYYIFAKPGSSNTLATSITALGTQFNEFEKTFVAIIVTFVLMVFMALAFPNISKEGVAYAGLGILAIFTYYGWFSLIWLIVLAFITLGLKVMGGRL